MATQEARSCVRRSHWRHPVSPFSQCILVARKARFLDRSLGVALASSWIQSCFWCRQDSHSNDGRTHSKLVGMLPALRKTAAMKNSHSVFKPSSIIVSSTLSRSFVYQVINDIISLSILPWNGSCDVHEHAQFVISQMYRSSRPFQVAFIEPILFSLRVMSVEIQYRTLAVNIWNIPKNIS